MSMKKALLTSSALIFGGLSLQCPLAYESDYAQTNSMKRAVSGAVLSHRREDSHELEMTKDAERLMLMKLKDDSLKLGVENLKESGTRGETEIRIWVGAGIMYPRLFILKARGGDYQARYVAPRRPEDEAAGTAGEQGATVRTDLYEPPSGWVGFDSFLRERGVGLPMTLSPDAKRTPEVDGGLVVLEAKSGGRYGMVFYYLNTQSEDGRKALEVCRRIEQEFFVKMGCEGPS